MTWRRDQVFSNPTTANTLSVPFLGAASISANTSSSISPSLSISTSLSGSQSMSSVDSSSTKPVNNSTQIPPDQLPAPPMSDVTTSTNSPPEDEITTAAPPIADPTTATNSPSSRSQHSSSFTSSRRSITQANPVTLAPSSHGLPSPAAPTKTKTSVTVQDMKATGPTRTSTIIDKPESTFSSLVPITVTSADGKVGILTPAVVTLLSTSMRSDGDFVTYTHIVANPTGVINGDAALTNNKFLDNHGAVAGVFVVVGIVIASLCACITLYWRRRLRELRRKRWLAGMRQQRPFSAPNPFDDVWAGGPQMTTAQRVDETSPRNSMSHRLSMGSSQQHSAAGLVHDGERAPVFQAAPKDQRQQPTGPSIAVLIPEQDMADSRASLSRSSPSLYPPTLPDDDHGVENALAESEWNAPVANDSIVKAPPRPPRSQLRQSVHRKPPEGYPVTPPSSAGSHSPPLSADRESDQRKPQSKFTNRRTLLDVRPRTSHEVLDRL